MLSYLWRTPGVPLAEEYPNSLFSVSSVSYVVKRQLKFVCKQTQFVPIRYCTSGCQETTSNKARTYIQAHAPFKATTTH